MGNTEEYLEDFDKGEELDISALPETQKRACQRELEELKAKERGNAKKKKEIK